MLARWLWLLSPWVVWGGHFLGVYLIASVADVVARADHPAWRMGALAFSAVCVVVAAGIAVIGWRRAGRSGEFIDQLAGLSGALAALSIVWQGLPTLIGH